MRADRDRDERAHSGRPNESGSGNQILDFDSVLNPQ